MAIEPVPTINRSIIFGTIALIYFFRINESSNLSSISTKIPLICEYNYTKTYEHPDEIYTCTVNDVNITDVYAEIESISGTHLPEKKDSDVEQIFFRQGSMFYIPNGIGKIFENLKVLKIGDLNTLTSLGTKTVKKSNFENMERLEQISFLSTDIKKIEKDALWNLPNLQVLMVWANRLKFLNERTFERNQNLTTVALISTDLRDVPTFLFRYNFALQNVMFYNSLLSDFDEQLFRTNPQLSTVSFASNKLESLSANSFKDNLLIKKVDFSDNSLKYVHLDFTQFSNIEYIGLELNDCIDASYYRRNSTAFQSYDSLTKFQELINAGCNLALA